jgi:hypothetical protein
VEGFVHDVEWAWAMRGVASLVTMDVQGAYDALLPRRLLRRLRDQGWHIRTLRLVRSFLASRKIRAKIDRAHAGLMDVPYGTPQGSP